MIKKITFVVLIFIFRFAQSGINYNLLRFNHYGNEDGLPQNVVTAIHQDNKGYLWIGTNDGLAKFNGYEFEKMYYDPYMNNSLIGNNILHICNYSPNVLMITTTIGVSFYDIEKNEFKNVYVAIKGLGTIENAVLNKKKEIVISTTRGTYNIYLKDTAGGVTLGTVDTGANLPAATANFKTAIIANAVGGAIRASNNSNDIHRAFSINLTADGDIGTTATPFKTDTSYLAAYAKDGGINISNSSFDASASPLALILGAIKTTQISNGIALTAVDDGNGNIRLVDGSQGTKDIIINTVGNLVLTDTINATRNLSLNAGGAIQTSGRLTNGVMVLPTLTAVKFSATAAGDIGLAAQAIKTNIENVTANTTNGGVFLSEQNGLRRADITATKDISLNADTGDIVLGALTTQKQQTNNSVTTATKATVSSKKGAILAATTNPAATNIQAGELDISTLSSIGTAKKPKITS